MRRQPPTPPTEPTDYVLHDKKILNKPQRLGKTSIDREKLKNSAHQSREERANAMTDMLLRPASWTSDVNISIRSQHIFIFPTAGFADEICLHLSRRFLLLPPLVVAKATKGLGRLIHASMSYPLVNRKS